MTDASLRDLADRTEITQVLYRYSRGLDRMDRDLALSIWHDDGTADYGGPEGSMNAADTVEMIWKSHEGYDRHSHQMTNHLIDVAGDRAVSETYAMVTLRKVPEDGIILQRQAVCRYLDRWSRRDGRWAIDHRQLIIDFLTDTEHDESVTRISPKSIRGLTDDSFELFEVGSARIKR
jgi:hypothetical protein